MRVLVVDDHKIVRKGLMSIITENFSDVSFGEASDSQTALQMVHESAPGISRCSTPTSPATKQTTSAC